LKGVSCRVRRTGSAKQRPCAAGLYSARSWGDRPLGLGPADVLGGPVVTDGTGAADDSWGWADPADARGTHRRHKPCADSWSSWETTRNQCPDRGLLRRPAARWSLPCGVRGSPRFASSSHLDSVPSLPTGSGGGRHTLPHAPRVRTTNSVFRRGSCISAVVRQTCGTHCHMRDRSRSIAVRGLAGSDRRAVDESETGQNARLVPGRQPYPSDRCAARVPMRVRVTGSIPSSFWGRYVWPTVWFHVQSWSP
jgi:hypothetical protein